MPFLRIIFDVYFYKSYIFLNHFLSDTKNSVERERKEKIENSLEKRYSVGEGCRGVLAPIQMSEQSKVWPCSILFYVSIKRIGLWDFMYNVFVEYHHGLWTYTYIIISYVYSIFLVSVCTNYNISAFRIGGLNHSPCFSLLRWSWGTYQIFSPKT